MVASKRNGDVSDVGRSNFYVPTLGPSSMAWTHSKHPKDADASYGGEEGWPCTRTLVGTCQATNQASTFDELLCAWAESVVP